MNLNPGDPCRVRLHDGRVVEGKYLEPSCNSKCHRVSIEGFDGWFVAIPHKPILSNACRFVGNPCVLEPV